MKSHRLNAEHAELAELAELYWVLLCGLRGLCVELRISEQGTERTEKNPDLLLGVLGFSVVSFTLTTDAWTDTPYNRKCCSRITQL